MLWNFNFYANTITYPWYYHHLRHAVNWLTCHVARTWPLKQSEGSAQTPSTFKLLGGRGSEEREPDHIIVLMITWLIMVITWLILVITRLILVITWLKPNEIMWLTPCCYVDENGYLFAGTNSIQCRDVPIVNLIWNQITDLQSRIGTGISPQRLHLWQVGTRIEGE